MAAKLERTSTPGIFRRHQGGAGGRVAASARTWSYGGIEGIESYAGRTARGFSETTRPEYRRPIEQHALKRWGSWRLADVEPADVRDIFGELRKAGATTSAIKKLRAALSALFATALEDGLIRSNPVQGYASPPHRRTTSRTLTNTRRPSRGPSRRLCSPRSRVSGGGSSSS